MSIIKHTKSFNIDQAIDNLFPLFTPEGEKLWVPDWDYENIMGSMQLKEDYIFLTKDHDHGSTEAIWLIKKFDPENYFVQYYKVEPKNKVGIITVSCSKIGQNSTKTQVSYEYIGLSEKGNKFIESFDSEQYDVFINEWEFLLKKYFETIE